MEYHRLELRQMHGDHRAAHRKRLQNETRHAFKFGREDAGVRRRQRRGHAGRILEAVTSGDVRDSGKFSEAGRIAGADIIEDDVAVQPPAQAIDGAEHQRRVLEFVQPAREHDAERRGAGGHRLRLEGVGVHPGP